MKKQRSHPIAQPPFPPSTKRQRQTPSELKKQHAISTLLTLFLFLFTQCMQPNTNSPTLILYNASFATMDSAYSQVEALAIRNGKIWQLGTKSEILALAGDSTRLMDLKGAFVMPGFIEGHGHFEGLGKSLMNLNFLHSRNWSEIVAQVAQAAQNTPPGTWIQGRGWHQEKWDAPPTETVGDYPLHHDLSAVTPHNPVILFHASGHALFANQAAMQAAGITPETQSPPGGAIIRNAAGEAIGVFEENAMDLIIRAWQQYLNQLPEKQRQTQWLQAINLAQQQCFKNGITTFTDAGCSPEEALQYQELSNSGKLQIRLYTMLNGTPSEIETALNQTQLPVFLSEKENFSCRAIKVYFDGALGSYGAWLLQPYNDLPESTGQNTTPIDSLRRFAKLALEHDLQLCVHAIGDRANREVLDLYETSFAERPNTTITEKRWRIEHAQHIHPDDIPRFGKMQVIPAMQSIHCTSDAPFVIERLGEERARTGAYPWRALLDSGARIANGTDAPVEEVDPIPNFYAAVTRKPAGSEQAFFPNQSMSREEALRSYTIDAAYAAFFDQITGSLSPGKWADIVVLSNNLLTCPEKEILNTRILHTFVRGTLVYSAQSDLEEPAPSNHQ